jgi:hypothetical protein
MNAPQIKSWSGLALVVTAGLVLIGGSGCQTTIGGQSLPSAYFLSDDVQYFPAGPQDKLFQERRALEQYKAGQEQQAGSPEAPNGGGPPAGGP